MRIWGRIPASPGAPPTIWVEVTTDANGENGNVYLTNLCQCLALNLNEDPFFSQYGIPAQPSVLSQIFPDYNTNLTQQQFQQYFALLTIKKRSSPTPTYDITAITFSGTILTAQVPV
jgi:hypothetical protein